MATLRDLVTGSDVCTPSDVAGPSNAASSLVNVLLGGRSKQQQQLAELPGVGQAGPSLVPAPYHPPTGAQAAEAALRLDLPAIPGLAPGDQHIEEFLRTQPPQHDFMNEFESIYAAQTPGTVAHPHPSPLPSTSEFESRTAVTPFLHSFFRSGGNAPPLPASSAVNLSVGDKCRVRDRSTILARQVFADQGSRYADQQVHKLLHTLNIDPAALPASNGGSLSQQHQWENVFNRAPTVAAEHAMAAVAAGTTSAPVQPWISEFESKMNLSQQSPSQQQPTSSSWAEQFSQETQKEENAWADEFRAASNAGTLTRQRTEASTAMEQTKRLADTLASNTDPKFQNSKFLQFVSKMSRGELIMEDNAVKEVSPEISKWADEFVAARQQQQQQGPSLWGEEFASFQDAQHPSNCWAEEFSTGPQAQDWADQFASGLTSTNEWAEQFAAENPSADIAGWEEEYLKELEKLHSEFSPQSFGEYRFAENNPFLSDIDSFAKGKELFKRGVLTEAVLALEAEVQRNPGNSEAWRLLGTVQAENDDDPQAIAALNRALAADPNDLDALLSLGVSHTNELDQHEALGFLREWVMRHPSHGIKAKQSPGPLDSSQSMAYVIGLYETAASNAPQDADVHAALGVLYNLSRKYDSAVLAFQAALKIRPQDYSLWNKLGATLANSARSSEAISAYQKALDLKPNYMRAWTNMGIGLANLGDYENSARYYVRALALNRHAVAVWGYLKNSLSCAAREDLMGMAEQEDLESLLKALPLAQIVLID